MRFSILLAVLLLGSVAAAQSPGEAPPRGPGFDVAPFLTSATPTSIHVAWETTGGTGAEVEFGPTQALGTTALGSSIAGTGGSLIHHVEIDGLEPDTRYFYVARSDPHVSAMGSFRTPPPLTAVTPFAFAAYSDTQIGNVADKHAEIIHDGILGFFDGEYGGAPIEDVLAFVLCAGDLVGTGSNVSHWRDHFFGQAGDLYRHVPSYPALGNHEANAGLYFKYFALPENGTPGFEEHWYAVDYQNVRLLSLDSNAPYTSQAQLDWLQAMLDDACANDTIDFVFAQMHHPHLSELWVPGELDFSTEVVSRLEQFSGDCGKPSIHFFGHTHGYSRGQSRDHDHLMVNVASGMGSVDYWYAFEQADYPEFQYSVPEWGFVVLDVEPGLDPSFRLRRVSRGNDFVFRDNEIVDEITVRRFNTGPDAPDALSPNPGSGDVTGWDVLLEGSTYAEPDGEAALESHWQVTTVQGDYTDPVADAWKRRENWYRPANGDSWYSVNTVTDPDVTHARLEQSLPGCAQVWWRVRYRDEGLAWSAWSEEQTFMVGESDGGPNAPDPADGAEGVAFDPVLRWFPCAPGDGYDVYLGTTPDLDVDDLLTSVTATEIQVEGLEPLTAYYWRIDKHTGGDVLAGNVWSFTTQAALPTVGTAEWRFDDLDPADGVALRAAHGESVLTPMGMTMGIDWDLGMTGDGAVPDIDGRRASFIRLDDVFGAGRGLQAFFNAPGNGGGGCCDAYEFTMIFDVYLEPGETDLQALWQGNANNANDAELFLAPSAGGFFVGGGTGYIGEDLWQPGQWVRIAHRVDYPASSALFVDGVKVLADDQLAAPDWFYALGSGLPGWMLSDDGPAGDVALVRCANLAIVDTLMGDEQIAALGGPDVDGIFVDVSEWRFDDAAPADGIALASAHGSSELIPTGMTLGADWGLETTDGTVVPHIDGLPTTYLWMDNVFGANQGLKTLLRARGNGGGGCCDAYHFTVVCDVYLESGETDLQAIWQGNAGNANDAELFLDPSTGGFFVGGGTGSIGQGLWEPGQWVRIAHRVDYPTSSALFVNGLKVLADDALTAPDWLYALGSDLPVWMLSDDGPGSDVTLVRCAALAIVDGLLSDETMLELGAPGAAGIFVDATDCPADTNGDGQVDVTDLLAVLSAWGPCSCPEDLDGDGEVAVGDLLMVLGAWGPCQR